MTHLTRNGIFNKAKTVKTNWTTNDSTHDDQRLMLQWPIWPEIEFLIRLKQLKPIGPLTILLMTINGYF